MQVFFECQNPSVAITFSKSVGFFFGHLDLGYKLGEDGSIICCSVANKDAYNIPLDCEGKNTLTN